MAVTPASPEFVRIRSTATAESGRNLLDVKALKMHFPLTQGIIFQRQVRAVPALRGVHFVVGKCESLRAVGVCACGKRTTTGAPFPARLTTPAAGEYEGHR